jgi:hypothetical protein
VGQEKRKPQFLVCCSIQLSYLSRCLGKVMADGELQNARVTVNLRPRKSMMTGAGAPVKGFDQPKPLRAKSAITAGADVSKPTTSSMPASFGLAMVNLLATIPTTVSLAGMPIF